MTGSLTDRVLIITGGGGGLGREIAMLYASMGGRVLINDVGSSPDGRERAANPADRVAAEIRAAGFSACANNDSVETWKSARRIVEAAVDNFGRIDAVINCAGFQRNSAFEAITPDDFGAVVKVHLYGSFFVSRAAAPYLIARKSGAYLHMTSTAGIIGTLGMSNYAAAKSGIVGLSRSMALELAQHGVRSNCLAPSAASRQRANIDKAQAQGFGEIGTRPLVSAQGEPRQVAPVAVFLISDEAREVTGQIVGVRGNELYLYSQPRPVLKVHDESGWTMKSLERDFLPSIRSKLVPLETFGEVFNTPVR